jgi:hypothetical protein
VFAQIASLVQIVLGSIKPVAEFKDRLTRDAALTDMLRFYFVLKDTVETGESLIVEAGSNPAAKLKIMAVDEAAMTVKRWNHELRVQGSRLYWLEGMLLGQEHLAVLTPDLEDELVKAIGYKTSRLVTLHGIGAALVFNGMLGTAETGDDVASLIVAMAGEPGREAIDLNRVRWEVTELRKVLEQYRGLTEQLMTKDEVLRLSKAARASTAPPTADPEKQTV